MKKVLILFSIALVVVSCGKPKRYEDSIGKVVKDKSDLKNYSILLNDMDYIEDSDSYKHQYKLVYQPNNNPDTLMLEITGWYIVSPEFFEKNVDNMGMSLGEVKDYVLSKEVGPPGYQNYVGNEHYGSWQNRSDGTSFWGFYGRYAFMSSMFNMMSPRRSYYNDYNSYRSRGATYYGPSNGGSSYYGTNGTANKSNSTSKWGAKSSSFKQKIRSKVSKSSTKKSRSSRTSSRINSRSSSRSGRSTVRSSGGGFGK